MKGFLVGSVLVAVANVYACGDHTHDEHGRAHAHKRAFPTAPLAPPSRPLEWGDINILHTTDTHGWLLGHQKPSFPEPNYSGDFGDFASFVAHMKELAIKKDVDLLLVDSGDLHDGTGLSDGFPPGGVDAHDSNEFFKQLPYDVLAIGNHELYIYANALDMHQNFAPQFKGRYLSSNVNITYADSTGQVVNTPVGSRFAKFKTRKGRQVTALGVLFDFTGNSANTTVQKVADMVKEQWFLDAIKSEPDLFLLAGHMPIVRDDWPLVFNAVRAVHPTTPIMILGGHTHVRDCVQLDGRSMSLESGRYMETLGWMSMKFDKSPAGAPKKNITFSRRYLDPNRVTYEFHSKESNQTFDTRQGKSITHGLNDLAEKFDLDFVFGTAPHDFTINQAPYPSNNSLLSLFIEEAVPVSLSINNSRADIPHLIISSSGSQRFDIYAGPFTRNDQFTASPFVNTFFYIPNVPFADAAKMTPFMNDAGSENRKRRSLSGRFENEEEMYARGYVGGIYRKWLEEMSRRHGSEERRAAANLTLGYVTTDSCPGVGDDIPHTALPFFDFPDFISSPPPAVADSAPIDLVFLDFNQAQILETLNSVQSTENFTAADVQKYSDVTTNMVYGVYAQEAWN